MEDNKHIVMNKKDKEEEILIKPELDILNCLRDIYASRHGLYMLMWRDVIVRYKRTMLGFAWSLFRPLLSMTLFVFVFGRLGHLPSDGIPYALLVLAALLPWMLFVNTVSIGSMALIDNAAMLRRMYFPRIMIPMASLLIHVSDCLISLGVFIGLAFFYHVTIDFRILLLPFFMLHTILLTLGVVYFLSILSVRYRDIGYLLPFLVQMGFFISPIGYTTSLIPDNLKYFFYLNPIVGLVDAFRWALLAGRVPMRWDAYGVSLSMAVALFIAGGVFFIRQEPKVADIL